MNMVKESFYEKKMGSIMFMLMVLDTKSQKRLMNNTKKMIGKKKYTK